MYISGTGISSFKFFTNLNYTIRTYIAIKWAQASNGDWFYTDRGSSGDYYECDISMSGYQCDVENVVTQINNNRVSGSNVITLDGFEDNEKIFGADIVYDTLTATVIKFPKITQGSTRFFTVTLSLRLLAPFSFVSYTALPQLTFTQIGYDANIDEATITKYDSYNGDFSYLDENRDVGLFKGTLILTDDDMAQLRRYQAIYRGEHFTITDIPGVLFPFGPTGDTYPVDVRIKNINNERMRGMSRWFCDIELVNYKAVNA